MPPMKEHQTQNRVAQAQEYCQRALQYYKKGNQAGAVKCLGVALDLDRTLRKDERIMRFAARIMDLPADQAIDALTDSKNREALILQAGKEKITRKSTPFYANPLWVVGSALLFLTVMGLVALLLSGQLKLNPADPFASQGEVELFHLASDAEQAYLVADPNGVPPFNGWPVLVALHGSGQTGQDMVDLLGDMTRNNGILLIAPTFTAVQNGNVNDSFYPKASSTLVSIIEEVKADGLRNHRHFMNYLGEIFFGYTEGSPLATYVAQQGMDYSDAGFARQGPIGVVLVNPRAPLFDAATYWSPPVYLLLYGELAPHASVSRDYNRRLKNQGAAVYMEAEKGANASMTADQINILASFVLEAYNPTPIMDATATP